MGCSCVTKHEASYKYPFQPSVHPRQGVQALQRVSGLGPWFHMLPFARMHQPIPIFYNPSQELLGGRVSVIACVNMSMMNSTRISQT